MKPFVLVGLILFATSATSSGGSAVSSALTLYDICMNNEVPQELSYWEFVKPTPIVPVVGTSCNISLMPYSDTVAIDFVISGEHEKTQNAVVGYKSALLISFRFEEKTLILNSHYDEWDFEKKFNSPVTTEPGSRNPINIIVKLGKRGFLVIVSDFWREFYWYKLPYWKIKEIRVYGDTWSEINMIVEEKPWDDKFFGI